MQSLPTRFLGNSGLKVTVFGFGNWVTGHKKEDEDNQIQIIKEAFNAGINFFDTAEAYGFGTAETIMGKAIKQIDCRREQLVISTKLFWGSKDATSHNERGLNRKHIIEGMNNSLKRLQLDYVDVIFCHRPDYQTPLEETCRAMSSLIDKDKAFYWGTSEWQAADIAASIEICERLNLHKPIAEQCQYNLLSRDRFEKEYRTLYERYQYGTTIWSPLQGGILSGKYNNGEIPQGSRLDQNQELMTNFNKLFSDDNKQKSIRMLNELKDFAEELGCTQAQLSLAWTVMNTDVSICILGISNLKQLESNIGALEICKKWTPEIEQRIEKIMQNTPEAERDFKTWIPRTQRRQEALWDAKY